MNAGADTHEGYNPWLIALVVSIATFMEVLDTTITNVSISHIAGTLGATQEESTWVLTSYLVANGIVLPLSGWLSNVLGRKRFFLSCIAGFTIASFACGAATSLGMLVVFRLLQGFAGGGLQPTQQAIILDAFPISKRGAVFGITGITLIAAPIIGPTLGGWITDNMTWRWIFFINIPVGTLALLLVNRMVTDPPNAKATGFKSIDYIGLAFVVIALGAMQIVLDKGEQDDWFGSNFICTLFAISLTAWISGIFWLLRQKDPVIDLRLIKDRCFGLSCLLIFLTGFSLYGGTTLLPLLVQTQFGYDATLAGLMLSAGGVMVIFLMPLVGKLVSKIEARYLIAFGLAITTFGMWRTTHITPQTDYMHFVWMRIVQVLGIPFLFIPVSTLAFMNVPKEKNNKASAIYAMCRNLGGSVGIAIMATYETRHQQIHQSYISEALSPYNPVFENRLHALTQYIINQGVAPVAAGAQAMGNLYQELLRQASIMAYNDTYGILAVIMSMGVICTFFLPRNNPRKAAAAPAAH